MLLWTETRNSPCHRGEGNSVAYFQILFCSPLYFLTRKRWGAFAINATLYGLAWLFLITIIGAMFAPLFWFLAAGHASFSLRQETIEQHAELLATKMAEKLKQ